MSVKKFVKHPQKYIVTIITGVVIIAAFFYATRVNSRRGRIVFNEHLDETAVTVCGKELSLKDLAFYVAYEEGEMQKQAMTYDASNPEKYWQLHIDGYFVKELASDSAIQMAIHDEIFYQMALEQDIQLDDTETEYLENSQMDFWSDICEYDKQVALGVDEDNIYFAMEKIAIAQKCQMIYAQSSGEPEENYNFDGDAYIRILEEYDYKINDKVWDRVNFGYITVNN